MEVAGLIATGVALVQLSNYGIYVSGVILELALDHGKLGDEMKSFAKQVRSFSHEIGVAHSTLQHHIESVPDSPVTSYISKHDVLGSVAERSTLVRHGLRKAKIDISNINKSLLLRIYAIIQWTRKKASITGLVRDMESVKASMTLLVVTATLEAANLRTTRAGNPVRVRQQQREIKMLKKVLKGHMKVIEKLREERENVHASQRRDGSATKLDISIDIHLHDTLINLGRSMYEHDAIPEEVPRQASASRAGSSRRGRSRSLQREHARPITVHLPDSSPEPLSDPHDSMTSSPSPSSAAHASTPPSPDSEHHSAVDPPNEPPLLPQPPQDEKTALSHTRSADDPVRILRLVSTSAAESGYITTPSNPFRLATIVIDANLNGNVISTREAAELGLVVQMLAPGDEVALEFSSGRRESCVGKATIEWNRSNYPRPSFPSLTVECEVCNYCQPGLIFGRPFLENKARLWDERQERTAGPAQE